MSRCYLSASKRWLLRVQEMAFESAKGVQLRSERYTIGTRKTCFGVIKGVEWGSGWGKLRMKIFCYSPNLQYLCTRKYRVSNI